MNWSEEKISSFAEVTTGGTPSTDKREFWDGGTIPWLNSGDLNQGIVMKASNFITEEGYKSSSTKLMPPNTVLIALTGATAGLTALLKIEACANQSVTGIFPSEKHYPEFLYYFFKTQRQRILDAAWGGAQPHINQRYVKDYVVPLPPLVDQIKIATVLSKAEVLIKKRKENIDLLEEFLQSTFFKMFGKMEDSFFPVSSLEEIATKINDGEHGTVKKTESGVMYVMAGNITRFNELDLSGVSYVSREAHEKMYRRCNPEKGDILIVCVGATIGKVVIVPEMEVFSIARSVALVKPNFKKVNSHYLLSFFNSDFAKRQMKNSSNASAQAGLYIGKIKEIKIPIPPIELQNHFAEIAIKAEALKEQFKSSLKDLENLYGSLSQRAFKDELDLSELEVYKKEEEYQSFSNDRTELDHFPPPKIVVEKKVKAREKKYGDLSKIDELTAKKKGELYFKEWQKYHPFKTVAFYGGGEAEIKWEWLANQIKHRYANKHFNFEMLMNFIKKEKLADNVKYYSSEEMKANPKLNDAEDVKAFLHTAITNVLMDEEQARKTNLFLKLKQVFYNAEKENFQLILHKEDFKLLKNRTAQERSGMYFMIEQ